MGTVGARGYLCEVPRGHSWQLRGGTAVVASALVMPAVTACADDEPKPRGWEVGLELDESEGALLSVWGDAADDVWAVGGQPGAVDAGGQATMVHFDGAAWSEHALPASLGDLPMLNWIYGVDGQLVTVGEGGVVLRSASGAGDDWTLEPTPTDVPLWGVWGPSAEDLWAVGGDATPNSGAPALLHYEGGSWVEVTVPDLDRNCDALFKVWGAGGDEVFAVGDAGIILRYDGVEWTQVPSGVSADLISLWGTGPDDIVAVGGRSNGTVLRWDGEAWSGDTLLGAPGLNGVWVGEDGEATVVGTLGFAARVPTTNDYEQEQSEAGPLVLHAVFGFDGGERFAVGGTLDRSPPLRGILVQSL